MPSTQPDPDAAARRTLTRHRAFATGLLLAMVGLILLARRLPPGPWTELLEASARAGLVGGLADWFAVTALFRHPLGLPIPHTAIIPAQKARLGAALGRFVANHVFTGREVARILGQLDMPAIIQRFLADPAASRPAAEALAGLMPRLLASIEDGRARRLAARLLPRLAGGPGAGRVVARALRGLVNGGRHQEVLAFLMVQLKAAILAKEDQLQAAVAERVREQAGRLSGWALGASIARRTLTTLHAELDKLTAGGSDLRDAFDEWVRREIDLLENDEARAAELGQAIRRLLAHQTMQAWMWDVWARLRRALEQDAERPNGHTIALIESALGNIGQVLTDDPAARARVQHATEAIAANLLPSGRAQLADFIAGVVGGWDSATLVDRLELRVGKDLQYIRINGTLVGFVAGGALFLLLRGVF